MKRSIAVALFGAVCFLAGLAFKPLVSAMAQGKNQTEEDKKTSPRAMAGKAIYISAEDIKKRFVDAAPQGASHLAWDPAYRFTVMRRPYYETAKKMNSGQVSHWDDAEMHEDKTQIYIMVAGTGTLALGGTAQNIRDTPEGQHSGQPLVGATLQKVKPGDWIVIPPMTWHQTQPDPGQTFVYGMCHIETRNTRP
jgi:mannose-6-phosphate isomerase-like protein (cupin superfamily)